jgi:hypothetical protein
MSFLCFPDVTVLDFAKSAEVVYQAVLCCVPIQTAHENFAGIRGEEWFG